MPKNQPLDHVASQLLGLMMLGCYLEGRDGHIWIEERIGRDNEDRGASGLSSRLREGGISLNNKIYGGIREALDTIDEALLRAGSDPLAVIHVGNTPSFYGPALFAGPPGYDASRIDPAGPGAGGLN